MGVEVIQHHSDPFSLWEMNFSQILHAPSEILFGYQNFFDDVLSTCT